jgi:NAD(P)-dependent dehydrogenase (short-subunit alcohol dehydrogenase family)
MTDGIAGQPDGGAKTAVIIGAGQGIGRAIALHMATNGVHPILVGRTERKLQAVADELRALGQSATVYVADATSSGQLAGLAAVITVRGGVLDMLINCAGEAFLASVEQTPEQMWERLLAINLKSSFLAVQRLLPYLRKSANASIILLSSKVALKGYPTVVAYTAAKAGVVGMARSLAAELRPDGIRVAALCPGPVDTPMRWAATPDYDRKLVIAAESVAATVWHLVSLPRNTITGEVLIQSAEYD